LRSDGARVRRRERPQKSFAGDRKGGSDMPFTKARYGTRAKWRKYRRCVARVKRAGTAKSPYAVCRAAIYPRKKRRR